MICHDCQKEFRNEMALRGHRRVCRPRRAGNQLSAQPHRAAGEHSGELREQPAQQAAEHGAEHAQPAAERAVWAETSKLLYTAHENLQELAASAWEEAEGLASAQLRRWLPLLVRVSRCADAVERMVVRARVVPEPVLEAYLEAVKLRAEWTPTLGKVNSDRSEETEEYDRELLSRVVASLRALLSQFEGVLGSTVR